VVDANVSCTWREVAEAAVTTGVAGGVTVSVRVVGADTPERYRAVTLYVMVCAEVAALLSRKVVEVTY